MARGLRWDPQARWFRLYLARIRDGPDGENPRKVYPCDGGLDRAGSRCQNELIVALGDNLSGRMLQIHNFLKKFPFAGSKTRWASACRAGHAAERAGIRSHALTVICFDAAEIAVTSAPILTCMLKRFRNSSGVATCRGGRVPS